VLRARPRRLPEFKRFQAVGPLLGQASRDQECDSIVGAWHTFERAHSREFDAIEVRSPFTKAVFALEISSGAFSSMSVLEGYRDLESSLLLNCSLKDVVDARCQALRELAAAVGPRPVASVLEDLSTSLTLPVGALNRSCIYERNPKFPGL